MTTMRRGSANPVEDRQRTGHARMTLRLAGRSVDRIKSLPERHLGTSRCAIQSALMQTASWSLRRAPSGAGRGELMAERRGIGWRDR